MKKLLSVLLIGLLAAVFIGCGSKTEEIKLSNIDKDVTFGDLQLDNSKYEVTTNDNKKDIKIELTYKSNVMIVGKVTKIRNTIVTDLGKDYNKIDLTIYQHDPMDSVSYTYENGKWNKEVE